MIDGATLAGILAVYDLSVLLAMAIVAGFAMQWYALEAHREKLLWIAFISLVAISAYTLTVRF